jgi:hypothetical protein
LGAIFFLIFNNSFNLFGCNFAPVLQNKKDFAMNRGFSETNFSPTMPPQCSYLSSFSFVRETPNKKTKLIRLNFTLGFYGRPRKPLGSSIK